MASCKLKRREAGCCTLASMQANSSIAIQLVFPLVIRSALFGCRNLGLGEISAKFQN
jgi:hypothetical protein